jgi:sialic acid synthase SpsE
MYRSDFKQEQALRQLEDAIPYESLEGSADTTEVAWLRQVFRDTMNMWVATRIHGASASLCANGNVSYALLKCLDKFTKEVEYERLRSNG